MLTSFLRHHARAALTALLAFTFASCGDDPAAPKIEETEFASSLNVDLSAMTKTPSGLYWRDLVVGTGATASAGEHIFVHYVGAFPTGAVFDDNLVGETPLDFFLGAGQVIRGWDEGIEGMKEGGRRQLVVPPSLGYGKDANGPIPGNSILVFTVDLVDAP